MLIICMVCLQASFWLFSLNAAPFCNHSVHVRHGDRRQISQYLSHEAIVHKGVIQVDELQKRSD